MLRKLRWATLGPQYDWTRREYDMHGQHRELPEALARLAVGAAALLATLEGVGGVPAGALGRADRAGRGAGEGALTWRKYGGGGGGSLRSLGRWGRGRGYWGGGEGGIWERRYRGPTSRTKVL